MNKNGRFPQVILISLTFLTFLFGLQTLRVLFSLSLYVLRDRLGWSAIQIGILMFAFFALSFLAGLFRRWLGTEKMLLITAVSVSLFRLALQLWSGDPLIDLILAFLTTFCFMLFLPVYLGFARSQGAAAIQDFALGMLIGVTLDVALHGAFRTYDMAWQGGWLTAVLTLTLVVIQWLTVNMVVLNPDPETSADTDTTGLGLTWLALGLFLFLELLIFGNLARLTVLTGWTQPLSFLILLIAQLTGVLVMLWLINRRQGAVPSLITGVLGVLLVGALVMAWPTGWLAAVQVIFGQTLLAVLMGVIVIAIGAGNGRSGLRNLTLGNGFGWLLMAIFVFLYYAGYDLALPFKNDLLFPIAGLITAVCAFFAARTLPQSTTKSEKPLSWKVISSFFLLLLIPVFQFFYPLFQWTPLDYYYGPPVRVMTFNLHNGFDQMGHLGLEALAQVIEAEDPDIISLQEVNRGWVVNGSTDMLVWLSHRLGKKYEMPYSIIWGPTADPLWGNAILSRQPIYEVDLQTLPPSDLLLGRGFIWAEVDIGNEQYLNVINTHYHHKADGSDVRVEQSQAILDYLAERPFTLIMGDLNAEPPTPEIQLYRDNGFQDVVDVNNVTPGYTYDALNPFTRIDYILITPDLTAANTAVPPQPASDHLPVVTDIQPQN